jgi:hypothetical protein
MAKAGEDSSGLTCDDCVKHKVTKIAVKQSGKIGNKIDFMNLLLHPRKEFTPS